MEKFVEHQNSEGSSFPKETFPFDLLGALSASPCVCVCNSYFKFKILFANRFCWVDVGDGDFFKQNASIICFFIFRFESARFIWPRETNGMAFGCGATVYSIHSILTTQRIVYTTHVLCTTSYAVRADHKIG